MKRQRKIYGGKAVTARVVSIPYPTQHAPGCSVERWLSIWSWIHIVDADKLEAFMIIYFPNWHVRRILFPYSSTYIDAQTGDAFWDGFCVIFFLARRYHLLFFWRVFGVQSASIM